MAETLIRCTQNSFTQEVITGEDYQHRLIADEPERYGGADQGPTPYDLLLAALGSCTGMTMKVYANRKGIPLEGCEIKLSQDRIHAHDCEDCESESGFIHRIQRRITLFGPLTNEDRQELLRIAALCPVAKTLKREMKIEDSLIEAEDSSQKAA